MHELELIEKEIERFKRRGRSQLIIQWDVDSQTISELRKKGYLVLQVFKNDYVDTIVGWKKND